MINFKNYDEDDIIEIGIEGYDEVPFTVIAKDTDAKTLTVGANVAVGFCNWNGDNQSGCGWRNSHLRRWLHSEFYGRLPRDVRFKIIPVMKKSLNDLGMLTIGEDQIWVPSLSELGFEVGMNFGPYQVNDEGNAYEWLKTHQDWCLSKTLLGVGIEVDMVTRSISPDELFPASIIRSDDNLRYSAVVPFFVVSYR